MTFLRCCRWRFILRDRLAKNWRFLTPSKTRNLQSYNLSRTPPRQEQQRYNLNLIYHYTMILICRLILDNLNSLSKSELT